MKWVLFISSILFLVGGAIFSEKAYGVDLIEEKRYSDDLKVATSMALDKMEEIGIGVSERSMVVARRRGLIVVSFVRMGNTRGGAIHVVYDPAKKAIAHVQGEQ